MAKVLLVRRRITVSEKILVMKTTRKDQENEENILKQNEKAEGR